MPCSFLGCLCGKAVFPQRYMVVILSALAVVINYGQRVNLSLIITVMVSPKDKSNMTECGPRANQTKSSSSQYSWTEFDQQLLLSMYFVGYVINHVPGGYMADRLSVRHVLSGFMLAASILTLVSPFVVEYTYFWVYVVVRFLIGISHGPCFPASTTLMARWIPKHERATVGGITFAANSLGVILGTSVSGGLQILFKSWESVFYFWGAIGIVWYVFFILYVYSEPAAHPRLSPKEKENLEKWIIKREVDVKVNWCAMLLDVPVWALMFGQFGHGWMIFFLSTNMPKYFSDVLNFNMKKNTLISSLPYVLQWASSVASGELGDQMIKRNWSSVAFVRKFYTTVASVFPSICLVAIPYSGCSNILVAVWMCLALLTMGPFYCSLKVNVIDLTINFSGLLMAFVNGFGAFSGFMSPYIVAVLAGNNKLSEWKIVMWIIFGGASVTNILYVVLGSANRRKWDMHPDEWVEYKAKLDQDKADKKAKKEAKKQAKKEAKEAKEQAKGAKNA